MSKKIPHSGQPSHPGSLPAGNTSKGDDRNLVQIDEAFKEAQFEDKVWLFWERNKGAVIGAIAAVIIVVIGVLAWNQLQQSKLRQLQAEFSAAQTTEEQIAFAAANPSHPLAGIALLSAADHYYADEDFEQAAASYLNAAAPLHHNPELYGRALIGAGIAQARLGDTSAALQHLRRAATDLKVADALRAEAHYHASVIERDLGETEQATRSLQAILALQYAGLWHNRAEIALRSLNTTPEPVTP